MPTESEQQEQQEQQPHPAGEAETAGALLRHAREARGLDEKQVADQLRITVHYVKAIEADKYDKLPGVIFARGYLKSYASLLNLDAADIVARYEAATGTAQPGSRQPEMTQSAISGGGNTGMRWAMASAAAFVVLFVGIWVISGPTVESTGVADSGADRAAPANPDRARSNPLTSVQRAIADEPTLPVPEGPADRIATGSPLLPTSDPAEPVADRSGAAAQRVDVDTDSAVPAAAEAAVSAVDTDSNSDAAQQVAPEPDASAAAATAETTAPAADSIDASPEQAADQAPAGVTGADSESAEELVAINVLQGDNGERIIEVDAAGPDVLQISFSGESWVEVNDADQRLIYRDLRESGDVLEVSGNAPFNVLLGDAPLTSLRLNGSAIDVSDEIRIDNSARLTVGL